MYIKIGSLKIRLSNIILFAFVIVLFNGLITSTDMVIYFGLAVGWTFIAFIEDQHSFNKAFMNKAVVFLLLFMFFYLITQLCNYNLSTAIAGTFSTFLLYFPFIMAFYYIYSSDNTNKRSMCYILLIIIGYYIIKAITYYSANQGIARQIASNAEEELSGLGGNPYSIVIVTDFIALYFLNSCFSNRNKHSYKIIIAVLSLALALLLCFSIDSSITTISFIACIIVSIINGIFFNEKADISQKEIRRNRRSMLFFYVIIGLTIFLFGNIVGVFLQWLSSVMTIGGHFLTIRIEQIADVLQGGDFGNSMNLRIQLMGNSFRTFLNYPIFGIKITGLSVTSAVVGGHSEILDLFAYYGIFALLLFISLFYALRFLYKMGKTNDYFSIIIFLILISFFNPFHYTQALFGLLFIVPLLIDTFKSSE